MCPARRPVPAARSRRPAALTRVLAVVAALAAGSLSARPAVGQPAPVFLTYAKASIALEGNHGDRDRVELVEPGGKVSLVHTLSGAAAVATADGATGRFGTKASSGRGYTLGSGRVEGVSALYFQRKATAYTHPLEFYLHGEAWTPGGSYDWVRAMATANIAAYDNIQGEGTPLAKMYHQTLLLGGDERSQAFEGVGGGEISIPAYRGPGVAWYPVFLHYAMEAIATGGAEVDFSNTGTVYVPEVAGVTWYGADGYLSQQARPTWAPAPGGPPVTTAPEPAAVVLVAGGLVALGMGARRGRVAGLG